MKNTAPILSGLIALLLIFIITGLTSNIKHPESFNNTNDIKLDLPEEYSQATSTDTLIAIKQGDTLFVHFNNKYFSNFNTNYHVRNNCKAVK